MPTVTEERPDTAAGTSHRWWRSAACRDADRRLFDPEKPHAAAAHTIRRFCLGCPVIDQCREDAQENRGWGVWGGEFRTGQGGHTGKVWTLALLEGRSTAAPKAVTASGTAECRHCRRPRQVRGDGRLRLHWVPAGGGSKTRCPGSGYLPQETS